MRIGANYLAKGLAYQSKAIQYTYSRPFLSRNVNRGAVKGIKHGLYAGGGYEIAKDFISVGVEQGSAPLQPQYGQKANSQYQTRNRPTIRSSRRCPTKFRYRKNRRRSSYY